MADAVEGNFAPERRVRQERAKPRESRMEDGKPHFTNHFGDINEMVGHGVAVMGFRANPRQFVKFASKPFSKTLAFSLQPFLKNISSYQDTLIFNLR